MDTLHTVPLKKDTSYKKYASSEVASSFSSGSILCDKKEDLTQSTVCQNDDHNAKRFPDISIVWVQKIGTVKKKGPLKLIWRIYLRHSEVTLKKLIALIKEVLLNHFQCIFVKTTF